VGLFSEAGWFVLFAIIGIFTFFIVLAKKIWHGSEVVNSTFTN
jgi:hypothetical protein